MKPGAFDRWPRLDALFDRALDLDGVARERFLDDACGDDGDLREELRRLLSALGTSGDLLDAPLSWEDTDSAGEAAPAAPAWSGRRVGHYQVHELLGLGGMGAVYRADDTRLNRQVALKFLRPHLGADPGARARFVQEAQAASALDHANICTIYEIGDTDDGQVFIAMALATGETLRARLARGPLEPAEALGIARQVGAGLQRAHEAGIVHRDLKPANVMITDRGEVKILDFGIAKLEGATDITRPGARLGTVAYMSPEQARGDEVDQRTDVWAFGAVLYEMLRGVRPFRADGEQAVLYQILHEDPPPLEPSGPEAGALAAVAVRCLERDLDRRYPDLTAVLADLDLVASGETSLPLSGTSRISARRRRTTWSVGAGALVLVSASAITLWMPGQTVSFEARDWLLVADIDNRSGDSLLDRTLDGVLASGLSASKYVNVFPRNRVQQALMRMRRPITDPVTGDVALEVAQRWGIPVVLQTSIARVGEGYRLTGRLVDPETGIDLDVVSAEADRREALVPALDHLIADVRRRLGETRFEMLGTRAPLPGATTRSLQALQTFAEGNRLWDTGRLNEAAAEWREAIALDSTFAHAHSNLGDYYYQVQDRVRGEEHFEQALRYLDRLGRSERLWIRATIEGRRGNEDVAQATYETMVREFPDAEGAWFNLGSGYMRRRECDRAETALDQVLRIDPTQGQAHIQIATCYSAIGEFDTAIDRYERAFAMDSTYLNWAGVNHEYGNTLLRHGDRDRAELVFRRMAESTFPAGRASGLRSLGLYEMYRGHFEQAISALRQSTSIYQAQGSGLSQFRNLLYLAVAFEAIGREDARQEQLDEAGVLADTVAMNPHWLALLGALHARASQVETARRFLEAMMPTFNERNPQDHAARDLLRGEIALAEEDFDEAVVLFERSKANDDDGLRAAALATAYARAGRVDEAIAEFERTIALRALGWEAQAGWIQAHVELGRLYERRGDPARAIEYYNRFVQIWADADPDATPSVAEVQRHVAALRAEHGIG